MDLRWKLELILGLALITFVIVDISKGIHVPLSVPGFRQWTSVANTSKLRARSNWQVSADYGPVACKFGDDTIDGYIISPFVSTNRANQINLEVTYKLTCCSYVLSIGVYVYFSSSRVDNLNPNTHTFEQISSLRNTSSMIPSSTARVQFTSRFTIEMEGQMGIYLAFRDQGICGGIVSLKINYTSCPSSAGDLMSFPSEAAPNSTVAVQKVPGTCVLNSNVQFSQSDNYMFCYTNGSTKVHGGCRCNAGYQNFLSTSCKECPPKSYKSAPGNVKCTRCAANVQDGLMPRTTVCKCNDGYYRPTSSPDDPKVDCEAAPSSPMHVKTKKIGSTWVSLQWGSPLRQGTGDSPRYRVKAGCTKCITPPDKTTAKTYLNFSGLSAYTRYVFSVYSINNVTDAIGLDKAEYNSTSVMTGSGLPSEVQNLTKRFNLDGSVTVTWNEPVAKGGDDLRYYVTVNGESKFWTKREYTVEQEQGKKKYTVSVKAHTSSGFSKEVVITFEIRGKGISKSLLVAIGVPILVVLLIAVAVVVACNRRRQPKSLQAAYLAGGGVTLPNEYNSMVYVDPTTYENIEDALQEFARELDRYWVRLDCLIHGGEFADVYKGTLEKPLQKEKLVAIKVLKTNASKKARDDFLAEAAYTGQFEDPNVIHLEGVVVKSHPTLIVTEFMSNGSLDSFLKENDGKFTPLQLLRMARGVASGMTYLSEMSYIHRYLAARDIFVNKDMVCKIAGFGMSKELISDEKNTIKDDYVAFRWIAPEAIKQKKFSIASDVWSYGVLLWEIMSYGDSPYSDWDNNEVLERSISGYRLPPPVNCPKVVHNLMLSCWHKDCEERPKFKTIRNMIDNWIRSPELLGQET